MSNVTYFKSQLSLKRAYSSLSDLDNAIADLEDSIKNDKERLKLYAVSTPKDVINDDRDPISAISNDIDDILEFYNDQVLELFKLYRFKELIGNSVAQLKRYYPYNEM